LNCGHSRVSFINAPQPTISTSPAHLLRIPPVRLRPDANADNIETLGKDELGDHLGALTPETMRRVNRALAIALALAN
jgi:mRNA interferase MazF